MKVTREVEMEIASLRLTVDEMLNNDYVSENNEGILLQIGKIIAKMQPRYYEKELLNCVIDYYDKLESENMYLNAKVQ